MSYARYIRETYYKYDRDVLLLPAVFENFCEKSWIERILESINLPYNSQDWSDRTAPFTREIEKNDDTLGHNCPPKSTEIVNRIKATKERIRQDNNERAAIARNMILQRAKEKKISN